MSEREDEEEEIKYSNVVAGAADDDSIHCSFICLMYDVRANKRSCGGGSFFPASRKEAFLLIMLCFTINK